MKNKQKSRSGCRTCKIRRLRCDETKPGCRNCLAKNFECPGYQQRLQWSTKHEEAPIKRSLGPSDFEELVSAASESITREVRPQGQDNNESQPEASRPNTQRVVPKSLDAPSTLAPARLPSPDLTESDRAASEENDESLVEDIQDQAQIVFATPSPQPTDELGELDLVLSQQPVDIPTFLISHWFKTVCPAWSAFDSQVNPYRVLTSSLWSTSMPVYYALQAISAASLVERLPLVIRDAASTAPRMAAAAIKTELIKFSSGRGPGLPKELLVSLFCMSSSLCWMEAGQLGLQFVRQARAVLKCMDAASLSDGDLALLDFFNGCLIYEEMLRSVVSNDEIDFQNMLSWPEPSSSQSSVVVATPHAWTGVSSDVLRLFGKAMTLCRRSRTRFQQRIATTFRVLQDAMMDIAAARRLEEALLAVEIADDEAMTDALAVNGRHLHDATEAYRLSSLLQLYQTFPDLIATRIPSQVSSDGSVSWSEWVVPLALHIASLLESIPPSSMSCIQPLLCICAGSGFRFDDTAFPEFGQVVGPGAGFLDKRLATEDLDMVALGCGISELTLKISRARHFIMNRLHSLEFSLPAKPIGVAKDLLRAVWTAYDEEIQLPRRTHWIDVMVSNNLQSLFG